MGIIDDMISRTLNISFFIVRLCLFFNYPYFLALPAHANGLSTTISNYLNQPNELEYIESHLQLWLDSSNINGNNNLGLVSGQSIGTWIDLSGNNHHAVEVNADNMPIFNTNSVLFDGSNDGLTLPSNIIANTDYTIIAVEKRTNLHKVNYFLGQIKNTDGHFESFNKVLHIGYRDSTTFTVAQYANDFNATLATSYLANISNSISDISNTNQFSVYYNGQFMSTGTGNNSGPLSGDELLIGRSYDQFYSGHIMEVLIFNTTLNESQLSKINAYLAEKWELNSIIDSDNDSIFNSQDLCPYDNDNFTSNPENDYDSDGCLDSTNDNDDDNDGFSDDIELIYGSSPVNELDTPSIDLENTLSALNTSINISGINTKLTLWLDAKNTDFNSNSTLGNQNNVETWLDLSGKGNHAYAENTESTPLYTQNGIYFDGNNDGLKLNSNILSDTAYTIITVEKRSSLNRVNKIIGQVRTSNSHLDSFNKALHYGYRNETELAIAQYANDFYVPISELSDPTSINTAISNPNNNNQFKIYSNGQLIGSGNGNNPGHLKGSDILIGRSYDQYYHGHILEVLIFNDELNADQITLINAYLSQKWNLLNKNDSDNDGTVDNNDAFWLDPTESLDTDTDGIGNNQDTDDDNDGYSDIDETLHCNENSNPLNNNSIPTDYDNDFICSRIGPKMK